MTKVVRLYLKYIEKEGDIPYSDLCKYMFEVKQEIRSVKNKAIQMCWENTNKREDYKRVYGSYPSDNDIYGRNFRSYMYTCLSKKYKKSQTSNLSTSIEVGRKKYNNCQKDIFLGNQSIPSFKDNQPINIHNKSIKLLFENSVYIFVISLFSNEMKKDIGMPLKGGICFQPVVKNKSQKQIIGNCFNGKYKISSSELFYDKKKKQWYLNLCFSFENEKNNILDVNNIMGIDLGIAVVAYMSYNNSSDRDYIDGGQLEHFREQFKSRKRSLQEQRKYCKGGRIGHGVKTRLKTLDKLGQKESNFRDTMNHQYSKYIVNQAIKHNCGIIQMEDLSGISNKSNKFLKSWPYFDLQTKIEYKAKEAGIQVIKVNPKYTSQRCSQCGFIDKDNRRTQADFKCLSCGFKANADYNASQNIATPNIDNIIKNAISANSK